MMDEKSSMRENDFSTAIGIASIESKEPYTPYSWRKVSRAI
jgi:hypothetical protein